MEIGDEFVIAIGTMTMQKYSVNSSDLLMERQVLGIMYVAQGTFGWTMYAVKGKRTLS